MANKKYNQFTAGSYDAAKIFLIADPTTGALVKIPLSDIPSLYTQDGDLASNRTVNLNGNSLSFEQDAVPKLSVSALESLLQAYTPFGGGNRAFGVLQVNNTDGNATISASFNNDAKRAVTIWTANVDGSSITHTADTHTMIAGGETNLTVQSNKGELRSFDPTDDDNEGKFVTIADPTEVSTKMFANFNDGVKEAEIEAFADATTSSITHTADTHTFNINGVMSAVFGGNNFLSIDPTAGNEQAILRSYNTTDNDNVAKVETGTTNASASVLIKSDFNNGVKEASIDIYADATSATIQYTADHHNFNLQDFANNAAAVGGGLVSGDQYFTNTAGEGLMKIVI